MYIYIYVYLYICLYIYTYSYVYVYIYIEREREREATFESIPPESTRPSGRCVTHVTCHWSHFHWSHFGHVACHWSYLCHVICHWSHSYHVPCHWNHFVREHASVREVRHAGHLPLEPFVLEYFLSRDRSLDSFLAFDRATLPWQQHV